MDALNCLMTRRSVRKYKDTPVNDELIEQIIDAGLYAASGMGMQTPTVIAITNKKLRNEIAKINAEILGVSTDPFYGAPVILMVVSSTKEQQKTNVEDGSLCLGNMMLAAHALGLGTCWINRCREGLEYPCYQDLLKSLDLDPKSFIGVGHLALGYADGDLSNAAVRKSGRKFIVH